MNAAQLHLALNHLPVIGLIAFGAVLLYALWSGSREARLIALIGIAVSGLMAWPVSYTGHRAEDVVEALPGVTEALIERHEDAADIAGNLAILTGIAALLLLGLERWAPRFGKVGATLLTALLLISAAGVGWTAHLGGLIRHTELREGWVPPQDEQGNVISGHSDEDDDDKH